MTKYTKLFSIIFLASVGLFFVNCNHSSPTSQSVSSSSEAPFAEDDHASENGNAEESPRAYYLQVRMGMYHNCAVVSSGEVKCWGENDYGQLGNNDTIDQYAPVTAVGLTYPPILSVGGWHSCVVLDTGKVQCWGRDEWGQLGNGVGGDQHVPTDVPGMTNATQIAAGYFHTCALLSSGTVQCWGRNNYGQVGIGNTIDQQEPVTVTGFPTTVISIEAGGEHTCALLIGGQVYCWGRNDYGQVGIGTAINQTTPAPVAGLTNIYKISSGGYHVCAMKGSGESYCWGRNSNGQVGTGNTVHQYFPVQISTLPSDILDIQAGGWHTMALRSTGEVFVWGWNWYGQLGTGNTNDEYLPVSVPNLANVDFISIGNLNTCAIVYGSDVYCWGFNQSGQVGIGNIIEQHQPIYVPGLW